MPNVYFTADMHFGHANIIKYSHRPFASVDEMNQELIIRWNNVVQPDDTVVVLGDVAMGKIADTLPLVTQLAGRKILVPGNHDRCWEGHAKRRDRDVQMYQDVGFKIQNSSSWHVAQGWSYNNPWLLCHFPYKGDSHDNDRYVDHRPTDQGEWLLHGHVHDAWKINGRQINVGVDVWDFAPVSEQTLIDLIAKEA